MRAEPEAYLYELLGRLIQALLDRRYQATAFRTIQGVEAFHLRAGTIDQVFVEIPLRPGIGFLDQHLVERIGFRRLDIGLGQHRKTYAVR